MERDRMVELAPHTSSSNEKARQGIIYIKEKI
jgi:hypothetical protein